MWVLWKEGASGKRWPMARHQLVISMKELAMVGRYLDFERENGNRDLYVNLPITSRLLNISNKSLFSLRSLNRQTDKKVNYFRPVCNKG